MTIQELKTLLTGVKLRLRKKSDLLTAVHSYLLENSPEYGQAFHNNNDVDMREQRESFLYSLDPHFCEECGGEIPKECNGNCE